MVQMVTDDHCSDSEDESENVLESYQSAPKYINFSE